MKWGIVAVCAFTVLFFACTPKNAVDNAPISPKKMQQVLLDIHFAEVYSSMVDDSLHQSTVKNMDSLAVYYKQVLAHHNLTEKEFEESINWYRKNTSVFDTLYKNMITDLTELEGKQQAK